MRAVIAERGQVTIPKKLRNELGLQAGTVLDFETEKGKLIARKANLNDPVQAVMGCIGSGIHTDEVIKSLRGEK